MAEGAPSAPATGWLEAAVCLGLKCKPEKFKKLLASEEGGRPLLDFLSDPDSRRVFVLDGSKEKGEGELEYLRQEYAGWSPEVFQLIDNTPVRRRRAIRRAIRRALRRALV